MKSPLRFSLFTVFCLLLNPALRGEEAKTKDPAAKNPAGQSTPKLSPEEIKQTVEQLKSGKYKERNEATDRLMIAGREAIGPVAEAAKTDDLELGARCIDILKNIYKNGDAQTKTAAEKALKALQQGKHEAVAKWAGEALEKPAPAFPNGNGIRIGGGIIIRGGQRIVVRPAQRPQIQREVKVTEKDKTYHITDTMGGPNGRQIVIKITEKVKGKEKEKTTEIKAASLAELRTKHKDVYEIYRKHIGKAKLKMIAGNNVAPLQVQGRVVGGGVRINTRIVNGRREMDIDENGKKIQIADSNGKDIVMKVTETVNGKQKTTEYKAKDLAELKKKHAEAAKTYENYTSRVRVRGGGFFRGGARFGGRRGGIRQPRPAPGNANNAKARDQLEKARARLQDAVQKLTNYAARGNADPKELKKLSAEVKGAQADLQKAAENLLK